MIEIKNLTKSYDKKCILKNINLKINDNEYHDEYNSILLGENGPWHMSLFDIDIDMQ